MGVNLVAALWGFAEATLFFLVPDILLTDRAVVGLRSALAACGYAVAGALAGGAVMFAWGAYAPQRALAVIEALPAISPAMIDAVGTELDRRGLAAVPIGSFTGKPYKIYAAQAGRRGGDPIPFLLASIPGRLGRFLLLALIAAAVGRGPMRRWTVRRRRLAWLGGWAVFYACYFLLMPG